MTLLLFVVYKGENSALKYQAIDDILPDMLQFTEPQTLEVIDPINYGNKDAGLSSLCLWSGFSSFGKFTKDLESSHEVEHFHTLIGGV